MLLSFKRNFFYLLAYSCHLVFPLLLSLHCFPSLFPSLSPVIIPLTFANCYLHFPTLIPQLSFTATISSPHCSPLSVSSIFCHCSPFPFISPFIFLHSSPHLQSYQSYLFHLPFPPLFSFLPRRLKSDNLTFPLSLRPLVFLSYAPHLSSFLLSSTISSFSHQFSAFLQPFFLLLSPHSSSCFPTSFLLLSSLIFLPLLTPRPYRLYIRIPVHLGTHPILPSEPHHLNIGTCEKDCKCLQKTTPIFRKPSHFKKTIPVMS